MASLDDLIALLDLEPIEKDLYRGQHPETQLQRSFGGQVMAQALRAANSTVPTERVCHSLKGYFLRPGSTSAPILYSVVRARDGGSFSTRRVKAIQHGETIFLMSCSFKEPEEGLEHAEAVHHAARPPEECPPLAGEMSQRSAQAAELWEREWSSLDVRFACDSRSHPEETGARSQVWIRAAGRLPDDPRLHQEVLAYASDMTLLAVSTVPHPVEFLAPTVQMATIDHSMWFHRPIRADEWVLYDQHSPNASNGLGFSLGRLYSHGVLGASTAQEGLIRVVDPARRA